MNITYRRANNTDLGKILELQKCNLPIHISKAEIKHEGFVTLVYDIPTLTIMNAPYPHIVAMDENEIAGYALVLIQEYFHLVPDLEEMINSFENINVEGRELLSMKYFIMGQVCVSKAYRKRGVFRNLYLKMVETMSNDFDIIVTEIARSNVRSMNAHLGIGFQEIGSRIASDGAEWSIVGYKL